MNKSPEDTSAAQIDESAYTMEQRQTAMLASINDWLHGIGYEPISEESVTSAWQQIYARYADANSGKLPEQAKTDAENTFTIVRDGYLLNLSCMNTGTKQRFTKDRIVRNVQHLSTLVTIATIVSGATSVLSGPDDVDIPARFRNGTISVFEAKTYTDDLPALLQKINPINKT